jgi:acyl-coenzyme A thioesterase PaaI-like protein
LKLNIFMTSTKLDLQKPPKFLEILGSKGFKFDVELGTSLMNFVISKDLTHSNGTIVQGGFITAMLDAAMAHLIILKRNGEVNPLSLNINVNFIAPGSPGEFVVKGEITKMGKSIAFTSGELYQGDTLIATATATNKMIKL